MDLDASCVMFDEAGRAIDTIYYGQLYSKDGSIVHTGDNLTGAGEGDDEQIIVDLDRVPALELHARGRPGVETVRADSRSRRFARLVAERGPFDLVLVDGNHSFAAVTHDVRTVLPHTRMLALHDIVDDASPGVRRAWAELRAEHGDAFEFFEFVEQYPEVTELIGRPVLGIGLAIRREPARPVGPPPLQPGGPPLLVGTMGPRTLRSAAAWADGLAGFTLDLDLAATAGLYDVARSAWASAGRPAPLLTTSFWVALAPSSSTASGTSATGSWNGCPESSCHPRTPAVTSASTTSCTVHSLRSAIALRSARSSSSAATCRGAASVLT